jgi:hypothetical protein
LKSEPVTPAAIGSAGGPRVQGLTLPERRTFFNDTATTENTDAQSIEDLLKEDPDDSGLVKELRKQLRETKRTASSLETEVVGFRESRKQARISAVEAAVNGRDYPQAVVDALMDKVQEADETEFSTILSELTVVADEETPPTGDAPQVPSTPSPAELGQQIAAAAGAQGADSLKDKLLAAQSQEEVKQAALEGGLGNI